MQLYSVNPFCTAEKRIIYFDSSQEMLYKVDEGKGELIERLVIEYCSQPRTHGEIHEFLKRPRWCIDITIKNIIKPLLKQGKLILAYKGSSKRNGMYVRYVSSSVPIATEEAVLEFCQTPKTKQEIMKYFQIPTDNYYKKYVYDLVRRGKLFHTMSNFTSSENGQKMSTQMPTRPRCNDDLILNFCKEPKTRAEICEHFDLKNSRCYYYLKMLIEKGLLLKTKKTLTEAHKYMKLK